MERRRQSRTSVRVPICIETADGAQYPAEARDLSDGGMAVRSEYLLPPSLVCYVRRRDDHSAFAREASVVSLRDLPNGDFRLGLAFDGPGCATAEAEQELRAAC